jgi:hypothetical protein
MEKIVEKAIDDDEFMADFFSDASNVIIPEQCGSTFLFSQHPVSRSGACHT